MAVNGGHAGTKEGANWGHVILENYWFGANQVRGSIPLGTLGLHFIILFSGIFSRNYFILAYIKTFWPNYFSYFVGFASLASPPTTYLIITSENSGEIHVRKDLMRMTSRDPSVSNGITQASFTPNVCSGINSAG